MISRNPVGGRRLPALVAHADWSSDPNKRWMAVGQLVDATYEMDVPEPVGEVASLLSRLHHRANGNSAILVGFDFPIGLPSSYAKRVGIARFLDSLPQFGAGQWESFYEIAANPDEISIYRPFYPFHSGGGSHAHLTSALGVSNIRELLRACERGGETRRDACALFWTLGAKQVGRGAIIGWRDVIAPVLRDSPHTAAVWPFHGGLDDLLKDRRYVIAETYPSEACLQLGLMPPGKGWSKRRPTDRQSVGKVLLKCAEHRGLFFTRNLEVEIRGGFGPKESGEDPFDALLGLMSMTEVLLGDRPEGAPITPAIREIEGWIFGMSPTRGF